MCIARIGDLGFCGGRLQIGAAVCTAASPSAPLQEQPRYRNSPATGTALLQEQQQRHRHHGHACNQAVDGGVVLARGDRGWQQLV